MPQVVSNAESRRSFLPSAYALANIPLRPGSTEACVSNVHHVIDTPGPPSLWRTMRRRGGTWVLLIVGVACSGAAGPQTERQVIRLSTGLPGAFFNPLGAALLGAYSKAMPYLTFAEVPSGGAVENLELLQRGAADLGFAFADVTYLAFVGRLDENTRPFDRLRGVAILQLTSIHVLIRRDSGITSIEQLRGRRVALGPSGSGTAISSKVLLEAFGVPLSELRGQYLPFLASANGVVRGELDAAFISAAYPAESVLTATRGGAHLLEVSGPVVERLRTNYPFLRVALIPAGTYPPFRLPVHTVGIDILIACNADLPETLVYSLTKTFFDVLPEMATKVDALRRMDLARAPATPIPLHGGAARYYRERELLR